MSFSRTDNQDDRTVRITAAILEYTEDCPSEFPGTIIDIETIGRFNQRYRYTNDSREYEYIRQVMFGFINSKRLHILYVRNEEDISELNERVARTLDQLERPFYAFNATFERAVLFHQLGEELLFEGELQGERYESKAKAVRALDIPNYGDPFYDKGILCQQAWEDGRFDMAVAHNRACLLKERDILLRRGFREPDELTLVS